MKGKRLFQSRYSHLIWFLPLVFLVSYWLVLPGVDQSEVVHWSSEEEYTYACEIGTIRLLFNLASFCLIPIGLFLLSSQKTRWLSLFLLLGVLMFCSGKITSFAHNSGKPSPREKALIQLNEGFTPVIQGIERFQKDKGRYPENLQELIPTYVKEIPPTNLRCFPRCDYLEGEKAKEYGGNPWVLVIDNPVGGEEILYCPLQNYPLYSRGEYVRQIGKWAYIWGRTTRTPAP